MLTAAEILNFLREQKPVFRQELNVIKIGLFGSYARGEQTSDSDIDLIVEFGPHTEDLTAKKDQLKSIVKSRFHKEVDVAREKFLKPYYKEQILQFAIYA